MHRQKSEIIQKYLAHCDYNAKVQTHVAGQSARLEHSDSDSDKIDELEDELKEMDSFKQRVVQIEELLENMKKQK